MEAVGELPARCPERHQSRSFIDRAFVSLKSHCLLDTSITFEIWQEAASLAHWGLSDRAVMQLKIQTACRGCT